MEFPIVINWSSPFLFYWMLGDVFHFYSSFKKKITQTNSGVPDQTPRSVAADLCCTFFLCPTKRTLGIYGLKMQLFCLSHKTCINLGSILSKKIFLVE